jgi:1,4-alpha-glucan branching enzyme
MENNEKNYLFHQGTYYHSYNHLGAHRVDENKFVFRVWAPNAKKISVVGDFNGWNANTNPMNKISHGIWEVYVENVNIYDCYKYEIVTQDDKVIKKADPYAFHSQTNGNDASKVYDLSGYEWKDKVYLKSRDKKNHYKSPMNIYEVNFASWKKYDDGNYFSYDKLREELIPYVKKMGYTHIELMPLYEFPFDGSWGYQQTGYFSITSRFGTPHQFMQFVDECHKNNIGIIMDWVPAHFAKDAFGLMEFDGGFLYEDSNPKRMEHKGWGTRIFDYGKTEIQSFLVSSAMMLFDVYHIDGIRVDAVASMLYLDYDRKDGEWDPNYHGENKNLEAVAFFQKLNAAIFSEFPSALMIAEESTAWPLVTKPTDIGGLGFNYKWNMGWMNDSLSYIKMDPYFRNTNSSKLTFSLYYAFSENFILPISHDEVVHGKCSLLNKMFGGYEEKFDLMRLFLLYMFAHPGKKLTFMGTEFAQFKEWAYKEGIDFCLLEYSKHLKMHEYNKDLNWVYRGDSCLYEEDFSWDGFEWISVDTDNNVFAFIRKNTVGREMLCVFNFSPLEIKDYRIGVKDEGKYELIFNTLEEKYGGVGVEKRFYQSIKESRHGKENSISIDLRGNEGLLIKLI